MNIFDISAEYFDALEALEIDENGEVLGYEKVEAIAEDFDNKAENIAQYIKELKYEAEDLKAEQDKLSERRKAVENKAEWLKGMLTEAFELVGKKELKTAKCRISFRPSESVNIIGVDYLPDEYKRIKTVIEADKDKIKKALKAGEEVIGAELIQKNNIQIK